MKKIYPLILFLLSFTFAETYLVPADFSTIQSAINSSSDGDSIIVSPGEYDESIDFNGKAIVLTSRYILDNDSLLIGLTIIDAQQNGSVATFNNSESNSSVLQGFTLQNGNGNEEDPDDNGSFYTYGGGIYCEESEPTIKDCIIQNNVANQGGGGGIFCYNASPVFYGCTISENTTDDVGGGLYTRQTSNPQFYNCTFLNNTAEFGGGCYLRNESTPIMDNVLFQENLANNSGGGISLKDNSDLEGNNIRLIGNEAEGLGGGLYVNNADPDFSFLLLANNLASSGGGTYIRNNSSVVFSNVTIANNTAGLYGDGIYLRDNSDLVVLNSVIWSNGSSPIYFRSDGEEVEMSVNYSLIQGSEDSIDDNENGVIEWGTGNIDEEPYFCNAPGGNYYIRQNSPCLYGGEDGSLVGCFTSGCGPINVGPVWYVDINGDDVNDGSIDAPYGSIERAITASVDGDTIRLKEGVYTELIDFEYKNLILESMAFEAQDMSLIEETVFGSSSIGGSCLVLNGSSNNNATIRGLTFRGGSEPYGGGIVISNCSPTLSDLIIEDNTAEIGGGVYLFESNAELKNLTIRNNGANFGGGIYISGGEPTLTNVSLKNNIAYWGGAIYSQNSNFNILYSTLSKNEAFIEGGALYQNSGLVNLEWTSFEGNNGYDYGGAIVSNQGSLNLDQVTFASNTAGVGSALSMHSSVVTIYNSILWSNNGELFYSPQESGLTSLEIGFTNIQGGVSIIEDLSTILLTDSGMNMNVDPLFCDLGSSVFNLQDTSPCLTSSNLDGVLGAYEPSCEEALFVDKSMVPLNFILSQNYPNPFNPSTQIRYEIFEYDLYEFTIYDISGKLIDAIFSEKKQPGRYFLRWNAKDLNGLMVPSGIYFYTLKNSKEQRSNRMILMK